MPLIQIVQGTYGLRTHEGKGVTPKNAKAAPFHVEQGEGERLVALGVARFVDTPAAKPSYNVSMTAAQLKEVMRSQGLEIGSDLTKAQMVAELDAFFSGEPPEEAPLPEETGGTTDAE